MRTVALAAVAVAGGWLATTVGYALMGAVVAAVWSQGEGGSTTAGVGVTPTDVLAAVSALLVVAVVTWLAARVLGDRAALAPRPTATVAAAGPLAGTAGTLAVFVANGGSPWAVLAHSAAAALGVGAALYAGARGRPVPW